MRRDFTDSAKKELLRLVREVEDEKWCDVTDWIGDRFYDLQDWMGLLKLNDDLSNVNSYHKKVIDKNNATEATINRIFDNVYSVESIYKSVFSDITSGVNAYRQIIAELTRIILPKNNCFTAANINSLKNDIRFRELQDIADIQAQWEARIQTKIDELKQKDIITSEDMDEFIRIYEVGNRELTVKIDKLLSKLSEEERRRIKYFIYTAEEPYKSIYLNQLESYKIGHTSGDDTGYFSPNNNKINVDMTVEPGNPRGPYTTYFHESGHAIDYNYNDDGSYYSLTYRNAEGKSLQDVIYEDVRNNVQEVVGMYTTDPEMTKNIVNYIMGGRSVELSALSPLEQQIYNSVSYYYRNEMAGGVNEACSDVYGGVTNNLIVGGFAHYPKDGNYDNYTYWYDKNGNATGNQSMELWAEFYSYAATGNEANMESLREHFPNAYEFLVEMSNSMV